MFLKSLKFIMMSILIYSTYFSQDIGTWKSYTSKKEVVKLASTNDDQVWCATSGGAFMYERSSNSFLQLAPSEGLSSPVLTSVAVDEMNQVWFGTQLGVDPGMLNVYNLESGTIQKINDIFNSDFTQKNINDLSESGDTILVSTEFGLALVNPINNSFYDTFLKFGDFDALRPVNTASSYNRFFVLLDDGVAVQKIGSSNLTAPEAWETFQFGSDISANFAFEFTRFGNKVLLATDQGIFEFVSNSWQPFLMETIEVVSIFTYGSGLYFATNENGVNKVYSYNGSSVSPVFENAERYQINDLIVTSNQTIYAATNSGLLEISGTNNQLLIPDGPTNNAFASLVVDQNGVLYVGTGRDVFGIGAMRFDGAKWDLLDKNTTPEIPSNAIHNVSVGSDNTVYFCNWGNGLTTLKDGTFKSFNATNTIIEGIPSNPNFLVVTDAERDSKGNIWILNLQSAGAYPLSMIDPNGDSYNFEFNNPKITENELAFHLEIDQFDTKWFAITSGDLGLYYFNENGTNDISTDDITGVIRSSDGLQSSSITALELDERGSLWVGTNTGVSIIPDPSNPTSRITTVNALRQQAVTAIAVDPLNQKWVATVQGLFHLSEDGINVLDQYNSENSPIPTNDIKSLSFDDKNGIAYVGTDFGLTALKTISVRPKDSMDELFLYPNPVVLGNNNTRITIEGLIANTSIKILTVSGKLIREFTAPGGNIAFWDGKDDEGNFVPSGVYLLIAYDEDGANTATGKIAVIRE